MPSKFECKQPLWVSDDPKTTNTWGYIRKESQSNLPQKK